jgi:hypothetical protein
VVTWLKKIFLPQNDYKESISSSYDIKPTVTPSPIVQTDIAQRRRMNRLRRSLDAQMEAANTRALKRHGADCVDMFACTKEDCFVWEPDKIVQKH